MPNTKRPCGCKCNGCIENTDQHCLHPPCKRKRNRRTKEQLDGVYRYPSGAAKKGDAYQERKNALRREATRKRRIVKELSKPPRKPKVAPTPPQRVTYPFLMITPSGKQLRLYGNTEEERAAMIANLEKHGYTLENE